MEMAKFKWKNSWASSKEWPSYWGSSLVRVRDGRRIYLVYVDANNNNINLFQLQVSSFHLRVSSKRWMPSERPFWFGSSVGFYRWWEPCVMPSWAHQCPFLVAIMHILMRLTADSLLSCIFGMRCWYLCKCRIDRRSKNHWRTTK